MNGRMETVPLPRAPSRPMLMVRLLMIVVGNLIPVCGVLALGWDAGAILILYWIENFIVGAFTLPRILMAQGPAPAARSVIGGTPLAARIGVALFFCVHYGIFWAVHGVFAFLLAASFAFGQPVGEPRFAWIGASFWLGALGLVLLHAVDFWRNWLKPGRWRGAEPKAEMFRPYGRLVVLHLTVLLGAFGLVSLGAPAWTMTLLCLGKMILELAGELGPRRFRARPVDQST